MSNFQSYKTITDRLQSLGGKLAEEKLSAEELDEFETLARQLYERALILNYKAKEAKVHGTEELRPDQDDKTSKKAEKEETKVPEQESVEENSNMGSSEIQFDFSDNGQETPVQKEEDTDTPEEEVSKEDLDEKPETTTSLKKEESPEPEDEKVEESETLSNDSINKVFENEKVQSFYEHFQKFHNESIGERIGASKLHTLKGAIGLNDKLQFIGELFDGDTDQFNKTIDALDQQPSNLDARKTLSQVAAKNAWDQENPLVEEFAKLIERRYGEE